MIAPRRVRLFLCLGITGALGFLLAFQLFLPPTVGQADNGDFWRIAAPLGVAHSPESLERNPFFGYFVRTYDFVRPFETKFVSSTRWIAGAAVRWQRAAGAERFDLLGLGFLRALLLVGIAFLMLCGLARHGRIAFILGAAFALFVLADTTTVAGFNSFYSEPDALLGMFLALAVLLVTPPGRAPTAIRLATLAAFISGVLLLSCAKIQFAFLGVPFLAAWLYRIRGWRGAPLAIALPVVAAAMVATLYHVTERIPAHVHVDNLYDLVFGSVLPWSDDPGATLSELGLDPEFACFAGTVAYLPESGMHEETLPPQLQKMGRARALRFLLRHPGCMADMTRRVAPDLWRARIANLGNFPRQAGHPPGAHSRAWSWWSETTYRVLRPPVPVFLLLLAANGLAALLGLAGRWRTEEREPLCLAQLLMVAVAGSQWLASLAGDGTFDFAKHFFLGRMAGQALLFFTIGMAAAAVRAPKAPRPPSDLSSMRR